MNIQKNNSLAFSSRTEKGKDYQKSKTGLQIGVVAGLGYGAYNYLGTNKGLAEFDKFISSEQVKTAIKKGKIEEFKSLVKKANFSKKLEKDTLKLVKFCGTNSEEFSKEMAKYANSSRIASKYKGPILAGNMIISVLMGLGAGAIFDKVINSARKDQVNEKTIEPPKSEKNINPYNIIKVKTVKEVEAIAKKEIGAMPYRIAACGYAMAPKGYEKPTHDFLKAVYLELGTGNTAFVTIPATLKGSVNTIASEITGPSKGKIIYITAQEFVKHIDSGNSQNTINMDNYSKLPKYVLPSHSAYIEATAQVSNVFIATGGRNVTASEFCMAIDKGNKAIILNNSLVEAPAWDFENNKIGNASKYFIEQLEAFKAGRSLPYPEVGPFTKDFLIENKSKLSKQVKVIQLNSSDNASVLKAAKETAAFIKGNDQS